MFSTWVRYWLERFPPLSSQNPEVDVFAPTSARSVKRVRLCADVYVWWSYTITATVHKQFKGAHLDVYLLSFHLTLFKKNETSRLKSGGGKTTGMPEEHRSSSPPRSKGNASISSSLFTSVTKNNSTFPVALFISHLLFWLEETLWGRADLTTTRRVFMD